MTKSQIIRELTIELAEKCKLARELDRSLNDALSRNLDLNDELRQAQQDSKTSDEVTEDYTLRYENERAARERVLEHVKALEAEIERMREDTMRLHEHWFSQVHNSRAPFQKALGIIK